MPRSFRENQETAINIKNRMENIARALVGYGGSETLYVDSGNVFRDVTGPYERKTIKRLSELWLAGEKEASIHVMWRDFGNKTHFSVGIRRKRGGPIEYVLGEEIKLGNNDDIQNDVNEGIEKNAADMVNHPPHYATHSSGVEAVDIGEHLSFNLGNAWKYIWRANLKGQREQDLKKAIWYLERETRLLNSLNQYHPVLREEFVVVLARKTFEKEQKSSVLGKSLDALFTYHVDLDGEKLLRTLLEAVRTELRLVLKGDR